MQTDRIAQFRTAPGIAAGSPGRRASPALGTPRFVTQSHALSAPIARPRSLFLAATIAIALYLLGRRISE